MDMSSINTLRRSALQGYHGLWYSVIHSVVLLSCVYRWRQVPYITVAVCAIIMLGICINLSKVLELIESIGDK